MRLLALLLLTLAVASCDPVKRVLGDPERKNKVANELVKEGLCRPDTFLLVVTDTLVKVDTIGVLYIQTDTIVDNDTVRLVQTKFRDIVKTVTIRDTLLKTIEDTKRVQVLTDENATLRGRLAERKGMQYDSMLWIALAGAVMGGTGVYLIRRK